MVALIVVIVILVGVLYALAAGNEKATQAITNGIIYRVAVVGVILLGILVYGAVFLR